MPEPDPFAHQPNPNVAGRSCSLCGRPATHKVAEEPYQIDVMCPRHPWTNYVCCGCFARIMGPAVQEWCGVHNPCEHGIADGEYCQPCNRAYKLAANDPENNERSRDTRCPEAHPDNRGERCCERAGQYNGYGSGGSLRFVCPKDCPCHD